MECQSTDIQSFELIMEMIMKWVIEIHSYVCCGAIPVGLTLTRDRAQHAESGMGVERGSGWKGL